MFIISKDFISEHQPFIYFLQIHTRTRCTYFLIKRYASIFKLMRIYLYEMAYAKSVLPICCYRVIQFLMYIISKDFISEHQIFIYFLQIRTRTRCTYFDIKRYASIFKPMRIYLYEMAYAKLVILIYCHRSDLSREYIQNTLRELYETA